MDYFDIIFIGISLAMDAFAVAVCKGIEGKDKSFFNCFKVGLFFGSFQALMPFFGYLLGNSIKSLVFNIDHYIVFCLLVIIGVKTIYDAFFDNEENIDSYFNLLTLVSLAFATSIDAFSVGITFALYKVNLLCSIIIIGIITFVLSFLGVCLGSFLSKRLNKGTKICGGVVLILFGIKFLIEGL